MCLQRHFISQVIAANDITAVFLTLPLIFYLNKKNKAFWCGLGQLIAALANLLPLLAWLVVPSSYVTSDITQGEQVELCQGRGEIFLQYSSPNFHCFHP